MAPGRAVEDLQHLVGRVQMRLVGRERAVLAVAAAGSRQRQREVATERDAAAHAGPGFYGAGPRGPFPRARPRAAGRRAPRPRAPSASAARPGRTPPCARGRARRSPRVSRTRASGLRPAGSGAPARSARARRTSGRRSAPAPRAARAAVSRRPRRARARARPRSARRRRSTRTGGLARTRLRGPSIRRSSTDLLGPDPPELLAGGFGRPHPCVISTRPVRCSRTASSPSMPASSSSFSAVWTAGTDAAWPKRWATSTRQCQSAFEYGWALHVTISTAAST